MDFATKTIEYKGNSLKLQIWDSAGQERYKALIPSYVRGASIVFIVYDVTNKNTFTNVITWINFIKQVNTDESYLVLCGNKIDMPRQVSTNEGKLLAQKENLFFYETSAKSGEGVHNMMFTCVAKLPFFDQFKIDNKDQLIKDLIEGNGSDINNGRKAPNKDIAQNINDENSSNYVLSKEKSNIDNKEENKKKCGC